MASAATSPCSSPTAIPSPVSASIPAASPTQSTCGRGDARARIVAPGRPAARRAGSARRGGPALRCEQALDLGARQVPRRVVHGADVEPPARHREQPDVAAQPPSMGEKS